MGTTPALTRQDCERIAKKAFQLMKREDFDQSRIVRRAAEGRQLSAGDLAMIDVRIRELKEGLAKNVLHVNEGQVRKGAAFETALKAGLVHNGVADAGSCPSLAAFIRSRCEELAGAH